RARFADRNGGSRRGRYIRHHACSTKKLRSSAPAEPSRWAGAKLGDGSRDWISLPAPWQQVTRSAWTHSGHQAHLRIEHQPVNAGRPLQLRPSPMHPVLAEERQVEILVVQVLPETLERLVPRLPRERLGFAVAPIELRITANPEASTTDVIGVEDSRAI